MDTVKPRGRGEGGGMAGCSFTGASGWWNDQQGNHLKLPMYTFFNQF